jgi:hypothetical protein
VKEEETMTPRQSFEMPQHLRELADGNVEQMRAAYAQFMDAMAQGASLWLGAMPVNEVTSGIKSIQEQGMRFAKKNADDCFVLASKLANAKDLPDVFAIHTRYAQTQMQTYVSQAQEIGRLMAETGQGLQRTG